MKHFYLTFFISAFFLIPIFSFAQIPTSFGGRVTSIKMPPNVNCPGSSESPFYITPAGPFSPGPWYGLGGFGTITPGGYILGLMTPIPAMCVLETPVGPVPYPALFSNYYGTSFGF